MDPADDNRLILKRAVCQQDRDALALLHIKYYEKLKHYIAYHINFIEDAEDLAQDVFVELCRGKVPYDGNGNVKRYLYGIARNTIHRYNRRRRKSPRTISIDWTSNLGCNYDIQQPLSATEQISSQKIKRLIEDFEAQLSPKAYEAIRLRYIEGLCPKEAAQKAVCSMKAFYSRLERAMQRLRKIKRQTGQAD